MFRKLIEKLMKTKVVHVQVGPKKLKWLGEQDFIKREIEERRMKYRDFPHFSVAPQPYLGGPETHYLYGRYFI